MNKIGEIITNATPAVYVLRGDSGEVVYVGQSKNVAARVAAHAAGPKKFSSATVFACDESNLNDLEAFLIKAIMPRYNSKSGTPALSRSLISGVYWLGDLPPAALDMRLSYEPTGPVRLIDRSDDEGIRKQSAPKKRVRPAAKSVLANDSQRRITSSVVREMCGGVSDMSIWRWLNDPALNFPKPIYIAKRRYWKEADVIAWLEGRATHEEQ